MGQEIIERKVHTSLNYFLQEILLKHGLIPKLNSLYIAAVENVMFEVVSSF
jgi:hypothetical protein